MTLPTDSQAAFDVVYEGPAVADHTMPIRDLAPALLALGQAFDRANTLLNGERASISLEIRATQQGSFEIALVLKQLFDSGLSVFSGDFFSSAANLKELFFGGGAVGLFALIKRSKGKPVRQISAASDSTVIEMENVRLTIPLALWKLLADTLLRDNIEAVVRPVAKQGIDRVVFKDAARRLETVGKDDVPSFQTNEVTYTNTTETLIPRQRLRPAAINFIRNGKWRLNDGDKTRWYTITDERFMREVNDGSRRFGAADLFVCEVVMVQSVDDTGALHLDYRISEVLNHIEPPAQGQMLDADG